MVWFLCTKCSCPHNTKFVKCESCREANRLAAAKRRKKCKEKNIRDECRLRKTIRQLHFSDRERGRDTQQGTKITADFAKWMYGFQQGKCAYCNVKMMTGQRYTDNQLTIERIYNNLPHIASNCVLACWKCNCRERAKPRLEFKTNYAAYLTVRRSWICVAADHFKTFPPD